MAQVIKIKRGGISGLSGASTTQGELIIATGSLGNNVDGPFLLAHGDSLGLVAGAVFTGSSVPTITDPQLNGILFYDNANSRFYRLDNNGNQALDIQATSFSGDTDGVSEGSTNLYYTDARVKTKLDNENVVSGSKANVLSFLNVEDGADVTDTANVTTALNSISVTAHNDITNAGSGIIISAAERTQLSTAAAFTASLDADLATFSVPASTTISDFGKTLVDDANATTARATLGVDAAGTDNSTDVTLAGSLDYITISDQQITRNAINVSTDLNVTPTATGLAVFTGSNATAIRATLNVDQAGTDNSTDVTLAGSYDYITISDQTITRNQITNDDLAGSIANAKLANSAITIAGQSTSLGGSVTAATILGAGSTSDLSEGSNLYYTDARVKTKLNSEGVISGSGMSPTFTNLTVEGNLSVEGTLTTVNSNEVNIGDRIIVLNSANGSGDAGINVYDADSPFSTGSLLYESTDNYWKAGVLGSEKRIVTFNANNPADNGFIYTNGDDEVVAAAGSTAGDILQWNGSAFAVSNEIDGGTY